MNIIERIIEKEWTMFHAVNEGQEKASCQESPHTFAAMRRCQFQAWSREACLSYEMDLDAAIASGRNLPEEKYIHMMKSCTPDRYAFVKDRLPEISQEHLDLADRLNAKLLAQTAVMRGSWPFLDIIARPVYAASDNEYTTSIETYNLGEFLTYSPATLQLLLEHVEALEAQGVSFVEQIELNCLRIMGCDSFEQAQQVVLRQQSGGGCHLR